MKQIALIGFLAAFSFAGQPALADGAGPSQVPQSAQAAPKGIYNPPKPKDGFRYPDCFCTDSKGERIELGKTVCLTIGSRSFTARCVMATNNPFWRQVTEGCPSV